MTEKVTVKAIRMSDEEQLRRWVAGDSVHRVFTRGGKTDYECCPDFSCCNPKLLAPLEKRQEFADASQSERERMCFEFLGGMLKSAGCEVVS
jgi:hypothetical protein